MTLPVYLDCNATTPVDPLARKAMLPWLSPTNHDPAARPRMKETLGRKVAGRDRKRFFTA